MAYILSPDDIQTYNEVHCKFRYALDVYYSGLQEFMKAENEDNYKLFIVPLGRTILD